jgi:hypothetical protein
MSSRSFRRRNNRRRHRQGAGDDAQGQRPGGPQDDRPEQGRGQRPSDRPPGGNPAQAGRGNQPQGSLGTPQGQRRPPSGRQPGGRPPEPQRPAQPSVPIMLPDCPVCGKQVRELASAVTHRVARQPAHFDCVMREIRDSNEVAPQEKVCYLGGGSFGIIELRPPGGPTRFVIRKRIQYEEKETPQDWKKVLQVTCLAPDGRAGTSALENQNPHDSMTLSPHAAIRPDTRRAGGEPDVAEIRPARASRRKPEVRL